MSLDSMHRREFLASAALASTALVGSPSVTRAEAAANPPVPSAGPGRMLKAVKIGMVQGNLSLVEKFKLLKELGFDGVELDSPGGPPGPEVARAREASGLPVHGVVDSTHWKMPFSHQDPKVRAQAVEDLKTALRDARAYGATTVLVVPGIVSKEAYYDDAYKRSQEEIRKALPMARETGVRIAIENVWNNFLLSPLEAARYVDEFESPMVGWYFDVGNIVRSGWPEHWIRVLGKRILKVDIKEYSRRKMNEQGVGKGFDVELHEGDCDWPAVMKAFRSIGYHGWATAEIGGGGRERLAQIASLMDRIFAS
jgi:hexulose-6-phosphate isomerase